MANPNEQQLRTLVSIFLKINPEPADAQVHGLAAAISMDHETLESLIYKMLGEAEEELGDDDLLQDPEEVNADSQDVLDDIELDPDTLPLDDVALNDGTVDESDIGFQEETYDDGADASDVGVSLTTSDGTDLLSDDGALVPQGA